MNSVVSFKNTDEVEILSNEDQSTQTSKSECKQIFSAENISPNRRNFGYTRMVDQVKKIDTEKGYKYLTSNELVEGPNLAELTLLYEAKLLEKDKILSVLGQDVVAKELDWLR